MRRHLISLLVSSLLLAACDSSNLKPFENLKQFDGKAPQTLLDQEPTNTEIRKVVPREKMACLKEHFNYMPDLRMRNTDVFGELTGSHADNWKYSMIRIESSGSIEIILKCDQDDKSELNVYTNGDVKKPSSMIKEWVSDNFSDGKVVLTNGNESVTVNAVELTSSKETRNNIDFSNISCPENPNVKYSMHIPSNPMDFKVASICKALKAESERLRNDAKRSVQDFCSIADNTVRKWGGYENAVKRLNETESDPNTLPAEKLIRNCAPWKRDDFIKEMESAMNVKLYSGGSFVSPMREKCNGLILKLENKKSFGFVLRGMDACETFDSQDLKETRGDSGIPPGDTIKNVLGYTGVLPSVYFFQGKERTFITKKDRP